MNQKSSFRVSRCMKVRREEDLILKALKRERDIMHEQTAAYAAGIDSVSALMLKDEVRAYRNLAGCFMRSGRIAEAIYLAVKLLHKDKYDLKALYILLSGQHFASKEAEDEELFMVYVYSLLDELYCLDEIKDRLLITSVLDNIEWHELSEYIME